MFSTAPISGLVLAGGKSSRMGRDKAQLNYHGKPQFQVVYQLLSSLADSTFVSCREAQAAAFAPLPTIVDQHEDIGPMAALLAAFQYNPNTAWLVLGCDYPNMDAAALAPLVRNRNSDAIATAFRNPDKNWPEPLLAIWEPASFTLLKNAYAEQRFSLKRVLEQHTVHLVEVQNLRSIQSVDTTVGFESFNKP